MSTAIGAPPAQRRTLLTLGFLVLVSLVAVWQPVASAVICVGFWGWVLIHTLGCGYLAVVPLFVLLTIPADYISWLSGGVLGLLPLTAVALLLAAAWVRGWRPPVSWSADFDLTLLMGVLAAGALIHYQTGQLRLLLFWITAGVALLWLRGLEGRLDVGRQLFWAILLAGALAGALGIMERLTGFRFESLLAGYQPARLDFGSSFGQRTSALSGHPLRLGTMTMLSAVFATAGLPVTTTSRERWVCWAALIASVGGLLSSGARGAWLGTSFGILGVVFCHRRLQPRDWRPLLVPALAIATLALGTGLWSLAHQRVSGEAFQPGSFGQRLAAIVTFEHVWSRAVLFGVGLGGVAELTSAAGLGLPNLENEYIRFFLAAGVLAPIALILLGLRRILWAARATTYIGAAAMGGILALLINAATYNLFSWSMGPTLLVALSVMALPFARED